jgi:predicted aspartyl protease
MGKVVVSAKIENLSDINRVEAGDIPQDQIRSLEVHDALVDTGASLLSLPTRHVVALGLRRIKSRTARTAAGVVTFGIYGAVRLTVQGRECVIEVCEIPNVCPQLIGQIPLEALDFVVDCNGQKLIGNPEHGGEQMIDLF